MHTLVTGKKIMMKYLRYALFLERLTGERCTTVARLVRGGKRRGQGEHMRISHATALLSECCEDEWPGYCGARHI